MRRLGLPLIAVALLLAGCGAPGGSSRTRLRIGGAQIPVELIRSWLRDASTRGFLTEPVEPVYLSQHGFEKLARGECDLACTDRMISPRERQLFSEKELTAYRIAFYGYALYVHKSNPLDAIYAGHLKMVFRKQITDWHQLVGNQIRELAGPIHLFGPRKGTRGGQVLAPLAAIWFSKSTWEELDSDSAIVDAVAADPLALGFASIGFDNENVRYLGLRMQRTGEANWPSLDEIESEAYGLAKVIYVYHTQPATPDVTAALEYFWSEEGRSVIQESAVWPIARERAPVVHSP
jgi:phosphate transport system substrate-binding protein